VKHSRRDYDIAVIGGGHAGVEAALVASRYGLRIALVTLDEKAIARMSCNPAIGGLAKGQMVREIDVLGGIMPFAADQSGLQFKILNRSKGRSVWSPRAQVDKRAYEFVVQKAVKNCPGLTVVSGEAVDIIESSSTVSGVLLRDGTRINSRAVILTCGTFLNGLIHIGDRKIRAGRMGESESSGITEALVSRGLNSGRLKTGTPPRLLRSSVNWKNTSKIIGDEKPVPFSFRTKNFQPLNVPCHAVRTNSECHEIINENLGRSPMFSGDILGIGPRYCPSIEDKIHRFAHRDSHMLFLEPEWLDSDQIYVNGFSTSLPEDVQLKALRQVPGLGNVQLLRPGYAIEYDYFFPSQHRATLESKIISGLFFAGQINGTSGYEEAAAQGLLAGINAAASIQNIEPLTLTRNEAYIGVLIDDLITKDTREPYRMFTSRAEHRLMLRYTNADRRLVEKARAHQLISDRQFTFLKKKINATDAVQMALQKSLNPHQINPSLLAQKERPIKQRQPAIHILKRPGISIQDIPDALFNSIDLSAFEPHQRNEILSEAETAIKYAGYIQRQNKTIARLQRQEQHKIPGDIDYLSIISLSAEGREKLNTIRPETLGQAMRISGVSPADISVLSVLLYKHP
jgi:tRNA uridine 5-carboxymethylaminomethyl modification enzyme